MSTLPDKEFPVMVIKALTEEWMDTARTSNRERERENTGKDQTEVKSELKHTPEEFNYRLDAIKA